MSEAGPRLREGEPGPQAPSRLDSVLPAVALFLTTLSVMVFEICLTRAFSVLLRYHFVFLVISVAVCGLGLGGLLDYLLRERRPQWTASREYLGVPLVLLAALYPLAVALLFATSLSLYLTSIWVLTAVCLPPFVCAGVFVSHVFARHSVSSGYLYFADLTGAALGSIAVIAVLQQYGGVNAAFPCGMMAAVAAALVFWWAKRRGLFWAAMALTAGLIFTMEANLVRRTIDLPYLSPTAGHLAKQLYAELGSGDPPERIVYSDWNAFARTDVVQIARADGTWDPTSDLLVYTDGEVPTNMLYFQGDLQQTATGLAEFLGMYPFRALQPKRVMLIGPGGGLDVLLALAVGAKEIDGAELNPAIPQIVRRFGKFCGPVYDYANVDIRVDEGRSALSRSRKQYDLIYMALTKTATTTSSSMALTEGYAQTVEAFEEYYRRLAPGGAVAFICQEPPLLLRMLLTARAAVQQETGKDELAAAQHLAVADWSPTGFALGPYRHLLLMMRDPLTPQRSAELAKMAIACGQEPVFFPGAFEQEPLALLTRKALPAEAFVAEINRLRPGVPAWDIRPCPDDRPFVVDISFAVPQEFWALVIVTGALVVALSLVAWPDLRRRQPGLAAGRFAGQVVYFALLGAGFMLVEVALIQKLILYLGYPVLSLSVILFALLLGGSLGSLYSQRWAPEHLRRRISQAGTGAVLYGVALAAIAPVLTRSTLYLDIQLRTLVTMALVLPLAWFLGMLFPSGMRLMAGENPRAVPWMWGVNGLSSVAGSVLAMILAKYYGFSVVLLLGLGMYVLVVALAQSRGAWQSGRSLEENG